MCGDQINKVDKDNAHIVTGQLATTLFRGIDLEDLNSSL